MTKLALYLLLWACQQVLKLTGRGAVEINERIKKMRIDKNE
jgi:hypothetical protein